MSFFKRGTIYCKFNVKSIGLWYMWRSLISSNLLSFVWNNIKLVSCTPDAETELHLFMLFIYPCIQRCPSCYEDCPIAVKRCRNRECGFHFQKKEKDWAAITDMGKTNPTVQRELLQKRVYIIYIYIYLLSCFFYII